MRQQPLERLSLRVDREHAPTAPEHFERVTPAPAAEVDGEAGLSEAVERAEQRLARIVASVLVIRRPLRRHAHSVAPQPN